MARILVVEDKFADGRALTRQLEEMGHETKHVVSQGQALSALADDGFDYVFLDLTLPDGDGVEVVPEIRRGGSAVVLLLEDAKEAMDAEVLGRIEALGETAFLTKPLAEDDIAASIETAETCRKARRDGESGAVAEKRPADTNVAAAEPAAQEPVEDATGVFGDKGLPKRLPKLKAYRDQMEKRYLRRLLKDSGGNVKKALAMAGISRASYYNLLNKHGLN
ncbi:MAG: response regulator [Oceanidesulfovibrio sp.]